MHFDIDIAVQRGEREIACRIAADTNLVALVGSSGAGKSSVLDAIAGLLRPMRGRIAIAGETLFDSDAGIDLPPEARRAGYVFQDLRLFPHRRVRANLTYGEKPGGWIGFDEVVALLDIAPLLDRWPATLSGGEAKRVAIGRALLSAPHFLLLDEPLASLDPARGEEILATIESIRDELGLPILHVSHDASEVARLTDIVVRID
ncbi:MAG: ATP-binding cassette domain-containing protein [Sphingomonadales bacterium]|nr:ATP-binding cassette domain-containing protein [Sphingomonadales bacterium]MBD3774536.1 ATP-binding cassette domain-containing protein [Paracoccaceae bacterium]